MKDRLRSLRKLASEIGRLLASDVDEETCDPNEVCSILADGSVPGER